MLEETRVVDLNEHIENLTCEVNVENNQPVAFIRFKNLGYGTLKAIKFMAQGFNAFGDLIPIKEEKSFILLVQDLSINPNSEISNIKVHLPHPDIRNIKLREKEVIFENGTKFTYEKPKKVKYTIQCLELNNPKDAEILKVYQEYEKTAICIPYKNEYGWVCLCGRFNKPKDHHCVKCGKEKEETLNYGKKEFIESKLQYAKIKRKKQETRKKKRKKIIAWITSIAIILTMIYFVIEFSSRMRYSSKSDMVNALEGTWANSFDAGNDINEKIVINEDKLTEQMEGDKSYTWTIDYYPSKGYLDTIDGKFIIKEKRGKTLLKSGKLYYEKISSDTELNTKEEVPSDTELNTEEDVSSDTELNTKEEVSVRDLFQEKVDEYNVTLDNFDVQYDTINNLDELFTLSGTAQLSDYYNYGFRGIEGTHFCLKVEPTGGKFSDQWYIYCDRESFADLFDKAKENGTINVQMICEIPEYSYKTNSGNLAYLRVAVY